MSIIPRQNIEPNPLQRALNDYHIMEAELTRATQRAVAAEAREAAMLAEVNMLRDALERADGQRIHLQAVSATLLGRLLAINDCIGGAVRASIKDGIEAVAEHKAKNEADDLEKAAVEVQGILQRVGQNVAPLEPPVRSLHHEAPQAAGAVIQQVDWRGTPGPLSPVR